MRSSCRFAPRTHGPSRLSGLRISPQAILLPGAPVTPAGDGSVGSQADVSHRPALMDSKVPSGVDLAVLAVAPAFDLPAITNPDECCHPAVAELTRWAGLPGRARYCPNRQSCRRFVSRTSARCRSPRRCRSGLRATARRSHRDRVGAKGAPTGNDARFAARRCVGVPRSPLEHALRHAPLAATLRPQHLLAVGPARRNAIPTLTVSKAPSGACVCPYSLSPQQTRTCLGAGHVNTGVNGREDALRHIGLGARCLPSRQPHRWPQGHGVGPARATALNTPSGTSVWPCSLSPQQAIAPSVRSPHECNRPVLTA